jgi:hypothetical protein
MRKLICVLIFALIFTACNADTPLADDSESVIPEITETPENINHPELEIELENEPEPELRAYEDGINISYPVFDHLSPEINALIRDKAHTALRDYDGLFDSHEEDDFTVSLELEINYEIMLMNENMLSVLFTGTAYISPAGVRPNNYLYSVNIDLQTGELIKLADVIEINEAFLELFLSDEINSEFFEQKEPFFEHYFEFYSEEDLLQRLQGVDSATWTDSSYYTESSVFISLGTIHVLGSYAVFEFPHDVLKNFIKDYF